MQAAWSRECSLYPSVTLGEEWLCLLQSAFWGLLHCCG